MYVTLDSTYFVKKAKLTVPKAINLNYVENLVISQDFKRFPDGTRIKTKDDAVVEFRILPGTQGLYGFIVSFIVLTKIGVFGGLQSLTTWNGFMILAACLPIAFGGLLSAISQGKAAVAGISLFAKDESAFPKALVSITLVEIYALLAFLISFLTVILL